jgi:hypothetical protein
MSNSALKIFIIDILRRVLSSCYQSDTTGSYKDNESIVLFLDPVSENSRIWNPNMTPLRIWIWKIDAHNTTIALKTSSKLWVHVKFPYAGYHIFYPFYQ